MNLISAIRPLVIAATGMFASAVATADVFDISVNNDAAQLSYSYAGDVDIESDSSGAQFGLLFNDDDAWMLSGKLVVPSANDTGIQLSPGIKISASNADEIDSDINLAIAIGGRISSLLATQLPLRAYGEVFIAPSITAFNDIEDIVDINLGIEYQPANNASFYAGFRRVEIEIEDTNDDVEIDDGLHIGVKLNF